MERTLLATESSAAVWRVGPLQASAAWCVNGARTQALVDGSIRVAPGQAGGRPVRLSLAEVDRPVAFAEPVLCEELEPALTLRPTDAECVMATLRHVESRWLGTTVARNWLGARLVACERTLKHRVYHVLGDGELLAVIDRGGDVGIAPGACLSGLETSRWVGLPSSASFIPPDFHRISWSELIWTYAVQSPIDHLPARYRSKLIFFRRPPKVAQRHVQDEHLLLMAELRAAPCKFDALQARTGMAERDLSKRLGELYLAGSITASPARASHAECSSAPWHGWHEAADERAWSRCGDSRYCGSVIDTERLEPSVPAVLHLG